MWCEKCDSLNYQPVEFTIFRVSPEKISKSPDHPTNRKWSITLVIVSPYPFRASHLSMARNSIYSPLNRSMGWFFKCGGVHRKIIDGFSSRISQEHPPFTSLHPFTSIYTSVYHHLHPLTHHENWHRKVKPLGLFSYPQPHPPHPHPSSCTSDDSSQRPWPGSICQALSVVSQASWNQALVAATRLPGPKKSHKNQSCIIFGWR